MLSGKKTDVLLIASKFLNISMLLGKTTVLLIALKILNVSMLSGEKLFYLLHQIS